MTSVSDAFNDGWPVQPEALFGRHTVIIDQPLIWCEHIRNAALAGCPELKDVTLRLLEIDGRDAWIAVSMSKDLFSRFTDEWLKGDRRIDWRFLIGWQFEKWASAHLVASGVSLPEWAL